MGAALFPLVVGLGNPGSAYAWTRHNFGFMVLDAWARAEHLNWKSARFADAAITQTGSGVWLFKPGSFMNRSGEPLRAAMEWFKLGPEQILVVVDDVNLPLGKLRLRAKGSAGGHNGLRSIEASLGSVAYARLRGGVGAAPGMLDLADHVLGRFMEEEKNDLENMTMRALKTLKVCQTAGLEAGIKEASTEV